MAFSVIILLYITIGVLAAAGSIFISKNLFTAKTEQIFFALFLIPIAGFYLAFTAYFGNDAAWQLEAGGVIVFTVLGFLGVRISFVLIAGYFLHGLWDILHEIQSHGRNDFIDVQQFTEIPMAYGVFCAVYDWCMAVYFYTRSITWRAAWSSN